jgi:hypothetical protein
MTDIEGLRAAMHTAVDGEKASADELIRQVMRRHRRHTIRVACITVLAALAVAVPGAITLHDWLGAPGPVPPANRNPHPARHLPAKITGLPMPAGTDFQFLVSAGNGAAWYSTATRQAEHISGLPRSQGGYQFSGVYGGWMARSNNTASQCAASNQCAGPPKEFYFIADGSLTATQIGAGYWVEASSRPGAVWLWTYPRASAKFTGSATAQLISTTGRPLGPRYHLPADWLPITGIGSYLQLNNNLNNNLTILWDPRTGRVLRHLDNVIATGPEQIAWSRACRGCRVQILNVSTGTTVTTPIPGGNPVAIDCPNLLCPGLNATFSDDGRLLAVQQPGRELEVFDTHSGTLAAIPGTALSSADWQNFGWQPGSHRLVISAGPNSRPGPAQLAYWQPGDAVLRVATVRNLRAIAEVQTGQLG